MCGWQRRAGARERVGWVCRALVVVAGAAWAQAEVGAQGPGEGGAQEAVSAGPMKPSVSVDSCAPGYGPGVLTDGKWFAQGQENPRERGPDRLGNAGNTWVSGESAVDHWMRLNWAEPVEIDELVIWWSLADWYPRAFRIEQLQDDKWVPVGPEQGWLAASERQSMVPLGAVRVRALRVLQPAAGSGVRPLMAAQEVTAWNRGGQAGALTGARRLSAAAFARLAPAELERNIARLDHSCPGASTAMTWAGDGQARPVVALADGDVEQPAARLSGQVAVGVGVEWPVAHVINGAAAVFRQVAPDAAALRVEAYDGQRWVAVKSGLKARADGAERRVEWSFEPVATRGVRIRGVEGIEEHDVTEVEVYRYLPDGKLVWPKRLTEREGLKQELLAAEGEPAFESVALAALSMRSEQALLGLKDGIREVGADWDGTLQGQGRLEFRIGAEQYRLAEFGDTVRRELIDGWRPGVVVRGRAENLAIAETAFVAPGKTGREGTLVVQVAVRNLADEVAKVPVEAMVRNAQAEGVEFQEGTLVGGGKLVLMAAEAARAGEAGDSLCVDLEIAPGQEGRATFVQPLDAVSRATAVAAYGGVSLETMLASFRQYWDEVLATQVAFEVPEARINRMVKAVLVQCFINGDGDVMPYGAVPSCYEGDLFGIEESYPILALALFGYGPDAQRYLEGTYLTPQFLEKAEEYHDTRYRHQQYRNGLEPHYAITAYRLGRDESWIRKHLPLIRECAEWTMASRRKTMAMENGERPLHWGLLPKWAYGGDIGEVTCYALFGNLCCWKGLVDTAWLLDELGDHEGAKRYADEAREFRVAIDRAIDGSYVKDHQPPFLPLRLYTDKPDEQLDYYQLFAGCMLDVEAFPIGSPRERWVTDYLEADNRMFCLLPRFRHIGAGALDAIYGKGYFLTKLHEGAVREFLLAFYAYLAFNMEQEVFTSRESNVLYASDVQARSAYRDADITGPLPCASAVALHLVRHMLVTEERDAAGGYSGGLLLLAGVPRAWLADGQTIRVRKAPTFYGPIDLEVQSYVGQGRIEVRLTPPSRNPHGAIRLRLPHPQGRKMQSVSIGGRAHTDFDADKEWVVVPADARGEVHIIAQY